jgi:kinesin family protein C2/C3
MLMMNSPPWLPIGSPGLNRKEDDKDSLSGDWVDKIMVKKHDTASRYENPMGHWEVDKRQLPEMFGQSFLRVPTKIHPELTANKKENPDYDLISGRYETATDDSDEHEAATSDSSEPDMLWQLNLPKGTNIPSGLGSKAKKTNLKPVAKSLESR